MAQTNVSPDRDASLGLIFRLNNLWSQVDYVSVGGLYEKWNSLLDALYRNLLFRESMIIDIDEKTGKITRIILSDKDTKSYRYFSLQIARAKRKYKEARSKTDKGRTKSRWYHSVQKKDIWLRKHMQKLKLYMKESEQRPGSTTFGTFGRGK